MRSFRLLLLLGVALLPRTAEAASLRSYTTLRAPVVHLSDLFADLGATPDAALGPSPAPGQRIVVEAPQLAAIAVQFGVSWQPASPGDEAVIERPGAPLPRAVVNAALREALANSGAPADADLTLDGFEPPLVATDATPHAEIVGLDYDGPSGRFSATLAVYADGAAPIHMQIAGSVDAMLELPTATHRLLAGQVVGPGDVAMTRVRASLVRGEPVATLAQAVGLALRGQIGPGAPLPASDLFRPPIVRRGQPVLMRIGGGGIALTAQGEALQSGAVGDRIRVLNPSSRAVLSALIDAPGEVSVDATSAPVLPAARFGGGDAYAMLTR